jgi:hypothetical protein
MYQLSFRLVSTSGFDQTYTINVYVNEGMDLWSSGFIFDAPPTIADQVLAYLIPGILALIVVYVAYSYLKRKRVL